MKIVHLTYDDVHNPWLGGGGAQRTMDIYRKLTGDYRVNVITGTYPGAREVTEGNRTQYRAGVVLGSNPSYAGYLLSRLSYTVGVWPHIRRADFDLLVDDFSAYAPAFSYLCRKAPVILSVRNIFSTNILKKYGPLGLVHFFLERYLLRRYRYFVVNSRSTRNALERILPTNNSCRIEMIPNGVDEKLFEVPEEKAVREDYILYLGRIDVFQKGLDVLVEAYASLAAQRDDLPGLLVCGDGKDRLKLQREIHRRGLEQRIRLKGRVEGEQHRRYLRECLFVVIPSRFESWGNVALEASACGKAVLGTRIEGLSETIVDRETGVMVAPNDQVSLREGITELLDNKNLREHLGSRGRSRALDFTWTNVLAKRKSFYAEVVEHYAEVDSKRSGTHS